MPLTPQTFDDSNWNRTRQIARPNFGSPPVKVPLYFAEVAARDTIVLSGIQTIDDVLLEANDQVLVTDNGSNNGVYKVVADGAWSLVSGTQAIDILVMVRNGTLNARTMWISDSDTPTFNTIRGGG